MRIAVIGGGPAGSLAATLLARAGARVTLVEQHRFPRDKVCGECLSALGRQVLRRHGLDSLLPPGRELVSARLFGPSTSVNLPLPEPMLGLSRACLDSTLLNAAASAGAEVRQPARVEAVHSDEQAVTINVRCLRTNQVETITADYVLAADGRATWAQPRPPPTTDLGIKAHFTNVNADPSAITLYGGMGCYGGVAPIEGDRWNVAFSVPKTTIGAYGGDLDRWWASVVGASAAMRRHFSQDRRVSEWLAAPLPRHRPAKQWPARVVPIGAAACAIEPIGGEGMGTALRSAELAADAILHGELVDLPGRYATLWNRRSLFCKLGGVLLANPDLSEAMSLADQPLFRSAALWAVGK